MFNREKLNLNEEIVEIKSIEKVSSEFENDQGKKIPYRTYRLKVKINGITFKFKLDKAFNETMDELIEELQEEE